jgi:kinesin family protein 20
LMFVDLAGSERHKQTQTQGQRIREAGEIHKTLSALQSCISIIRSNQADPTKKVRY